ncbi:MAG TPA: polyamine aminopropyltransferase [Spirochaetota bacterium]|nr:polyamine aminopropyltransferase [Spirochaetota bacterium]HPS85652.1 polyamine aminopropyltransferase [Spirochaetota bacterium]
MKADLQKNEQRILLFSVFILSLCGIIYELVLGSLASYLLGNPVQQYSVTIGVFLSSMGLGSYLSRYITKNLIKAFVRIEIFLGLIGGISVVLLNYFFSFSVSFYMLHVFFLVVIGTLVGLEIPLLTRILKSYGALKDIISNVLTLDYIGGLGGSLLFPLILFPYLGRYLTSIFVGVINIAVAVIVIVKIVDYSRRKLDLSLAFASLIILLFLAVNSDWVTAILNKKMFYDDIVFSKRSKYQEIVLTRSGDDFRLYLDGSLQFSTSDEYRYHEMLVYPPVMICGGRNISVLVLGGGDGLAVRELLRFKNVLHVTLVELDEYMVDLARNNSTLKTINNHSLSNERVYVVTGDAYDYLTKNSLKYDVIIADFPDPHDETVSKLYTDSFFKIVKRSLKSDGVFVTQSTSPLFAREAFWCINNTLGTVFKNVIPYHVFIPTFGDWGFNIGMDRYIKPGEIDESANSKFFTKETFKAAMHFPPDSDVVKTEINKFNRPILYLYYLKGWKNSDY